MASFWSIIQYIVPGGAEGKHLEDLLEEGCDIILNI